MDKRLQFWIFLFMLFHRLLGRAYLYSVAGGASLCSHGHEEFDRAFGLTVRHGVSPVILCAHETCAATKDQGFKTLADERNFHVGELRRVKSLVLDANSKAVVRMYYWRRVFGRDWWWRPEKI